MCVRALPGCTLRMYAQPVHAGTPGCGAGEMCARPECRRGQGSCGPEPWGGTTGAVAAAAPSTAPSPARCFPACRVLWGSCMCPAYVCGVSLGCGCLPQHVNPAGRAGLSSVRSWFPLQTGLGLACSVGPARPPAPQQGAVGRGVHPRASVHPAGSAAGASGSGRAPWQQGTALRSVWHGYSCNHSSRIRPLGLTQTAGQRAARAGRAARCRLPAHASSAMQAGLFPWVLVQ